MSTRHLYGRLLGAFLRWFEWVKVGYHDNFLPRAMHHPWLVFFGSGALIGAIGLLFVPTFGGPTIIPGARDAEGRRAAREAGLRPGRHDAAGARHHRGRGVPQVDGHGHHRRPDELAVPDALLVPVVYVCIMSWVDRAAARRLARKLKRDLADENAFDDDATAPQDEREPALR